MESQFNTYRRECPFCEATCSLVIEADVARGVLGRIKGDDTSPLSRGFVCAKSQGLRGLRDDPDRLRRPLLKTKGSFKEIEWDEAFERAAAGLRGVVEAGGADALAFYIGNPAGHNVGLMMGLFAMLATVGSKNIYSACSVDIMPRFLANIFMYGNRGVFPIPHIDKTHHLLIIGANPAASNGGTMTVPDFPRRVAALQKRGGQVTVIDPRRTETAALANTYHAIRPGADALFLLAFVHVLFGEGRVKLGHLHAHVDGLEALQEIVKRYAPERVAEAVGISAGDIRAVARAFADAPSAVAHGRVGTCCQQFGSLTSWLIDCINILTGNLDREGGCVFPPPVVPSIFSLAPYVGEQAPYDRYRSRVSGAPEVGGELPCHVLPEEILTPGPGQVRGLVTFAGNPVVSNANARLVRRALGDLEFMVSIDFYLNESTRFADLILPPVDPLGRSDFTFAYAPQIIGSYAQVSERVFPPAPGELEDLDILMELMARYAGQPRSTFETGFAQAFLSHFATGLKRWPKDKSVEQVLATYTSDAPLKDTLFDVLVRVGACGDGFGAYPDGLTLAQLQGRPEGVMLDLPYKDQLQHVLETPGKRLNLTPPVFVADLPRLDTAFDNGTFTAPGLRLIGRRHIRSNNSWMHNLDALVKGPPRCVLLIHPDDARRYGVRDGSKVEVRSRVGAVVIPAQFEEGMMRGVVCLPHGWGHDDPQARLSRAAQTPGANFNVLTNHLEFDVPSGNSVLSGIDVEVMPLLESVPA
ncbi:MAG: molybdopterin dinucleotide binding domain-containing protein [Steroidobacteraceae bacterium]